MKRNSRTSLAAGQRRSDACLPNTVPQHPQHEGIAAGQVRIDPQEKGASRPGAAQARAATPCGPASRGCSPCKSAAARKPACPAAPQNSPSAPHSRVPAAAPQNPPGTQTCPRSARNATPSPQAIKSFSCRMRVRLLVPWDGNRCQSTGLRENAGRVRDANRLPPRLPCIAQTTRPAKPCPHDAEAL